MNKHRDKSKIGLGYTDGLNRAQFLFDFYPAKPENVGSQTDWKPNKMPLKGWKNSLWC